MRHVFAFFAMLFVATDFLLLNFFQILTLPIGLFSKKKLKVVHHFLVDCCVDIFIFAMVKVVRAKISLSGDTPLPDENVIIIANHQAFADVPIVAYVASLHRRAKHLRYFCKNSFKWIPGPGWALHFSGAIFLKRNWAEDLVTINATFQELRESEDKFWFVIFPEGTRVNAKKIKASQEYMSTKGMDPLKTRIMPRVKGFHAAISGLGQRIDAVYDLSIQYKGVDKAPSLWRFVSGVDFNIHIKRYPISEIPKASSEQQRWLLERIKEKDGI